LYLALRFSARAPARSLQTVHGEATASVWDDRRAFMPGLAGGRVISRYNLAFALGRGRVRIRFWRPTVSGRPSRSGASGPLPDSQDLVMSNEQEHTEEHGSLIKTPKQLIVTVVLAFAVPIIVIIMLVNMVAAGSKTGAGSDALTAE